MFLILITQAIGKGSKRFHSIYNIYSKTTITDASLIYKA